MKTNFIKLTMPGTIETIYKCIKCDEVMTEQHIFLHNLKHKEEKLKKDLERKV